MLKDIKEYCDSCVVCAEQRKSKLRAYLHPLDVATAPFEVIGIDFFGPLKPTSTLGNNHVLVITDYFTKWVEAIPLPDQTALTTCKALMNKIIFKHGPPKILISDRGANFTSNLFKEICNALKIKHRTTTAYHPQTNGLTERFNKTVVEMLRKYISEGFQNWEEMLGPVVFAYNNSVHSSTLETPYFLNHGRDPAMSIDRFFIPPEQNIITPQDYKTLTMKRIFDAFQLVKQNLVQARIDQKEQYDKRACIQNYNIGDKVLLDVKVNKEGVSKKFNPRFTGPFRIQRLHSNNTVLIKEYESNQTQLVNINRIKPLFESVIWKDNEPPLEHNVVHNVEPHLTDPPSNASTDLPSSNPDQNIQPHNSPSHAEKNPPPERKQGLRPRSAINLPARFK